MTKVLAFDTTGDGCSAAVLRAGQVAARRFARMERGQAEALMPMIEAVLGEAETPIETLDLIGVTIGPGAFTGLRIGLAAARGLALASGIPALGVTSFAAVAAQVSLEERAGRTLVVALESKRAEFYLQAFGTDGNAWGEGALVAPAAIESWLPKGPIMLAGDAARRLANAMPEPKPPIASGAGIPDAADVARLAEAAWQAGLRPSSLRPLYLRAPDTTLSRQKVIGQ
jgi:tRNA threonylcarbamoyladenosine biosynthesis protein TsaB